MTRKPARTRSAAGMTLGSAVLLLAAVGSAGLALTGVAFAILDGEGDGLDDVWEAKYAFHTDDDGTLHPDEAPAADPDGDGHSNFQECVAGTDPRNPSLFRPGIAAPPGSLSPLPGTNSSTGNLDLHWWGVRGKCYRVESTEDFSAWSDEGIFLIGAGARLICPTPVNLVPGTPGPGRRFFRVIPVDLHSDSDELSDWGEHELGTAINDPDSDADGVLDHFEIMMHRDPTAPDNLPPVPGPTLLEVYAPSAAQPFQ